MSKVLDTQIHPLPFSELMGILAALCHLETELTHALGLLCLELALELVKQASRWVEDLAG